MTMTWVAGDKEVVVTVNGDERRYASLRTAVLRHNQLRDASGKGMRDWPVWVVECEGEIYHISYNGRMWFGKPGAWTDRTDEVHVLA